MRLAAIDIGTNSVHMIVVRVRPDLSFEVIDREKEMVRLGAGGLDGKALSVGKGAGKDLRPYRDGFDVMIPAGKHTLTVVVKGGGPHAVYVRLLDPDRKLRYPDAGEKK